MDEILVTVNIMKTRLRMAILLSLSLSCSALAEIYVITNKDGTKTFTDTPPANPADGSAVQASPNTTNVWEREANQQQLNEEYQAETAREQAQQEEVSSATNNELQEAAEQLQLAKDAYEQAQEVQEDDYFRNNKGGIRYKPEYQQRVDEAKQALDDAQSHYDSLQ